MNNNTINTIALIIFLININDNYNYSINIYFLLINIMNIIL